MDYERWEVTKKWLEVLPDSLVQTIFATLKARHPGLLTHAVIATVSSFPISRLDF